MESPEDWERLDKEAAEKLNATDRLYGAHLVSEIFLLGSGSQCIATADELDAAIERLCSLSHAKYRLQLERAKPVEPVTVELSTGPGKLSLIVNGPGGATLVEVPREQAVRLALVILAQEPARFDG